MTPPTKQFLAMWGNRWIGNAIPTIPNTMMTSMTMAASCRFSSSSKKDSDNDGIFGIAGDYLKKFQWKTAETLKANLTEEERSRFEATTRQDQSDTDTDGNKKTDYGGKNRPSIAELVAAAKVEEAQRLKGKMEDEWSKRESEVEEEIRKKLESSLAVQRRQIAFEKWKEDLEREKHLSNSPTTSSTSEPEPTSASFAEHPILGPVIRDLGYKRLHLTSITNLASLPVWEKQRFFRNERAKKMAADKEKTLHIGLPGVIGIYEKKDGQLEIIDGQHRVGMLKHLSEKEGTQEKFDFENILVEVYHQPEDEDPEKYVTALFKEINKAQPAKDVDLPGEVSAKDLEVINTAVRVISNTYKDMFKPSTNCRRPHLNMDNVRNDIFVNEVLKRNVIESADDLQEWMLRKNTELGERILSDNNATKNISEIALKKAKKHGFFLGLDNSWYKE